MDTVSNEYSVIQLINTLTGGEGSSLAETVDALIVACQKASGYFDACVQSCDDTDAEEVIYLRRALLLAKGIDIPLKVVVACPDCETLHVDAPEPETGWTNPPHKKHLCRECGCLWRPFGFATYGVEQHATESDGEAALVLAGE